MSTHSYPIPPNDELLEETPEELQGIAQRLQAAIDEVLVVTVDAVEPATITGVSDDANPGSVVSEARAATDRRLYFPDSEGWKFGVMSGPREYCSRRNPGEEWFHLLLDGELFLEFGEEKFCLNCAFRSGLLTDDRLFWQKGHRRQRIAPMSDTAPEIETSSESHADFSDQSLTANDIVENPAEGQA